MIDHDKELANGFFEDRLARIVHQKHVVRETEVPKLLHRLRNRIGCTSSSPGKRSAVMPTLQFHQRGAFISTGHHTISGNNIYSAVSGNVGIGTTAPSRKLHVAGDARIEGNLTIPETSRYFSIPGSTFRPWISSSGYYTDINWISALSPGQNVTLYAPVHVPNGATLEELHGVIRDKGPNDITLELYVITSTGEKFRLADVTSSGALTNTRSISTNLSSVVDNVNNAYLVVASWTAGDFSSGADIFLHKVRIKYSITNPLP